MMTLVTMSLAAIALVRSVDSGASCSATWRFKQDATAAQQRGHGSALTWLKANASGAALGVNSGRPVFRDKPGRAGPDRTHHLQHQQAGTLVDWHGDGKCLARRSDNFSGVHRAQDRGPGRRQHGQWVIMRLCAKREAMVAGNTCSRPLATSTSTASERGG